MFKKFLFSLFLLYSFPMVNATGNTHEYKDSSECKLENGISVIFMETSKSDLLMVALCVSAGSTDEIEKEGVANLLANILSQKYMSSRKENATQPVFESNFYTGYDQSVYYLQGKLENLDVFLKNLSELFLESSFDPLEIAASRNLVEQTIAGDEQIDRMLIKKEARKSMYWHSKYGSSIYGAKEDLKLINEDDIALFKKKHYTTDRVTIIIAGDISKNKALDAIKKYFGDIENTSSSLERLQEPEHHGSVVQITKYSDQVSVPVIEMYWKVPNYRNHREQALATEIYIKHLSDMLQKSLIDEQKNLSSIAFSYSFWNYDYGDFCMTVTAKNSDNIDEIIISVLSEIKYIASTALTKNQADAASQKLFETSKMCGKDPLEALDCFSRKISAGNDFEFVKKFALNINKYSLEEVNKQAKEIFGKDPCVICVIKPQSEITGASK
ncbi:MAG: insulinase family protein [Holosporaceae bacterium]|nr:insulinase family protein [Holosporaceae bacterium]